MPRIPYFTLLTILLRSFVAGAEPEVIAPASPVALGAHAGDLHFTDIRYIPRTLRDLGGHNATVLLFSSVGCPLVQRYLPRLAALDAEYGARGVVFVSVNVGPEDTIVEMAQQALDFGVPFPVVKDVDGSVAAAVGARRTPEVVVLDKEGAIRYRGRIDEQYRLGGVSPEEGRAYLREALEAVLAGDAVEVSETTVDGCLISPPTSIAGDSHLTYATDIAPIIHRHCVECHRGGGAAPFTLLNPRQVTGRAAMIAEVVMEERMPPWYASREHGTFVNAKGMSAEEKRLVAAWAAGGAALGNLDAAPEPPSFPETEWAIGEPDLVLRAEKVFEVPATGYIPYEYVTLPYEFPADTWIQGIEITPSNPAVVHHANLVYSFAEEGYDGELHFLTGKVPGGLPVDLRGDHAMMIPAKAVLTLQIHYVTTGKEERDRIAVGLRYAEGAIDKRIRYLILDDDTFAIPPGARAHEVAAEETLTCDATGIAMFGHMHLRGKDFRFTAAYPDGRMETLLSVPNYSFDWQMAYLWARDTKKFPKGTSIRCTAHYDNSAFNPYNPDATATVTYGAQTYEEMMFGYFFYTDDSEHLSMRVDGSTGYPQGPEVAGRDR
jgi:thiol-disulfide isomerase/thioredoxin